MSAVLLVCVCLALAIGVPVDVLDRFVVASHKLLAGASVLGTAQFCERVLARQRRARTRSLMTVERLVGGVSTSTSCERERVNRSTVDWVVIATDRDAKMTTSELVALLGACSRLTHYGVLMWAHEPVDPLLVRRYTDFVYVDDQSALIGAGARVYNRRQLIKVASPTRFAFELESELDIEWTDTAVLGQRRFRAYTPARLRRALALCEIVVAVNSDAAYREQRDMVRHTWAEPVLMAQMQICVFFVVASPSLALVNESDQHGDVLIFEATEGYNVTWSVLPLKGNGARQIALRHAQRAAWFFRCDDDTYVHTGNLFRLLASTARRSYNTSSVYIGCAFDSAPMRNVTGDKAKWNVAPNVYQAHRYPRFMSGGAGYALSRAAARCVAAATTERDWRYYDREDVLMRLTLADFCGPLVVDSRCDLFRPQFVDTPGSSVVTVHYARPAERIRSLHEQTHAVQI